MKDKEKAKRGGRSEPAMGLCFSLLFLLGLGIVDPLPAADPYIIGLSTARTGGAAMSYTPSSEGFRIYFEKINDAGGINGHPVKLLLEDDGGQGAKANSNVKLFAEAGAHLVMVTSASATYAPAIAEAKRANVPIVIGAGSVSAPQAYPPKPDPLVFVATDKGAGTESDKAVQSIAELAKGSVTMGMVVMDLPIAVAIAKKSGELAVKKGWKVVESRFPMGAVDLTPIADEWIQKGVNWACEHGPAGTRLLYPALMKRGWKGNFLFISESFNYLTDMKADNLYATAAVVPLEMNLPEHKEVVEAAKKYKASPFLTETLWGWEAAKVLEKVFRNAGWPVNTNRLLEVMNSIESDNRPLGKVTKWTPNDHAGSFVWRVYRWDKKEGKVVPATDWWLGSATGDVVKKIGPKL